MLRFDRGPVIRSAPVANTPLRGYKWLTLSTHRMTGVEPSRDVFASAGGF